MPDSVFRRFADRFRRPHPPPSPPVPDIPPTLDAAAAYFKGALARYATSPKGPLLLLNVYSGQPNPADLMTLPGTGVAGKAAWLLDYVDEGTKTGLSAADMISRDHGIALRKARATGLDGRAACRKVFGGASGTLDTLAQELSAAGISDMAGFAASRYGEFWKKYGLGA